VTDAPGTIATARLSLVPATPEFIQAILEGRRAEAARLLGAAVPLAWPSDRDSREGLPVYLLALRRGPEERAWAIRLVVLREERRLVGAITLKGPPGADGAVDIGWAIEPGDQRHGYAAEAAQAVRDWVLTQRGVRRVTARIQPDNEASMGVARRLGMQRTAERHPTQGVIWQLPMPVQR
jgi:RimJ/RimL family protein N-acetyltransferase